MKLPSRKYQTYGQRGKEVFSRYDGFQSKPQESRSFVLTENKTGDNKAACHFFGPIFITWSRGNITMAGDAGEIVLTHYYAMPTFEAAMDWLATAEVDYLLGKSNAHKVLAREDTWRDIVRWCNEQDAWTLRGGYGGDTAPEKLWEWNRLADYINEQTSFFLGKMDWLTRRVNAVERRTLREFLWQFLRDEPAAEVETFVYGFTDDAERTAARRYSDNDIFRVCLLRDFARTQVALLKAKKEST